MVDGDEQANFADPANDNTDGDRRTDVTEVEDGTRTNVPDVYVKLAYGSISVAESGDGGEAGEMDEGSDDCVVGFPGWAVPAGDLPGITEGRDLQLGYQSWSLHRKVTCASDNTFEFTVNLSLRAT